ncbi:hypothetical protein [Nitrospira sp. M1]
MYKILISLALLVIGSFYFLSLQAQENEKPTETIAYESYEDIPKPLRKALRRNSFLEQYIYLQLSFIRQKSQSKHYLSEEDLVELEKEMIAKARKRQLARMVKYDQNLDRQVTVDEVRSSMIKQQPSLEKPRNAEKLQKRLKAILRADHDQDGVLSYEEMSTLSPNEVKRIKQNSSKLYQEFLSLDPNHDGKLTVIELDTLARRAFSTVDKDGNAAISSEELEAFTEAVKYVFDVPAFCKLPQTGKGQQLRSIGIYKGSAISSVTAAGQDQVTTTVTVTVGDDVDSTYLVLTSFSPVIWQLSGNVNAISHVALHNNYPDKTEKLSSGITGIARNKVSFLSSRCMPNHRQAKSKETVLANSAIKQMIGRIPDLTEGHSQVGNITLSSDHAEFSSTRHAMSILKKPLPDGFHPELWSSFLKNYSGGVTAIDPQTVVADSNVEKYEVLPQQAGLAKLAYDGLITPGSRTVKILKNIPRFPAGLHGGHSVHFLIADGVEVPKGDPGHGCVRLEATGRVVSGRGSK